MNILFTGFGSTSRWRTPSETSVSSSTSWTWAKDGASSGKVWHRSSNQPPGNPQHWLRICVPFFPFWKKTSLLFRTRWQRMPRDSVFYYRSPIHRDNFVLSFAFSFDKEDERWVVSENIEPWKKKFARGKSARWGNDEDMQGASRQPETDRKVWRKKGVSIWKQCLVSWTRLFF